MPKTLRFFNSANGPEAPARALRRAKAACSKSAAEPPTGAMLLNFLCPWGRRSSGNGLTTEVQQPRQEGQSNVYTRPASVHLDCRTGVLLSIWDLHAVPSPKSRVSLNSYRAWAAIHLWFCTEAFDVTDKLPAKLIGSVERPGFDASHRNGKCLLKAIAADCVGWRSLPSKAWGGPTLAAGRSSNFEPHVCNSRSVHLPSLRVEQEEQKSGNSGTVALSGGVQLGHCPNMRDSGGAAHRWDESEPAMLTAGEMTPNNIRRGPVGRLVSAGETGASGRSIYFA